MNSHNSISGPNNKHYNLQFSIQPPQTFPNFLPDSPPQVKVSAEEQEDLID
ncbi:hypothetical protein F511_22076 [Dorcoceras hygrometricum]|uniref:Uncharacterized protein n=1 Tax=Dorcoceras hygrometricum TaxID=472368 RepID=A0A2Z7BZP9_9LAMI|nr:hypothetical protein F511_22076 [Dorcoceras hygrometricum]